MWDNGNGFVMSRQALKKDVLKKIFLCLALMIHNQIKKKVKLNIANLNLCHTVMP